MLELTDMPNPVISPVEHVQDPNSPSPIDCVYLVSIVLTVP